MIKAKQIHEFRGLTASQIDGETVFEVEKLIGGDFILLLETGDALLLETSDRLLLEGSSVEKWQNYKLPYAQLLARIISDLP